VPLFVKMLRNNMKLNRIVSIFLLVPFVCILLISLYGCNGTGKQRDGTSKSALVRLSISQYPEFYDDIAFDGLEQGIQNSLKYFNTRPDDEKYRFGDDFYQTAHLIKTLNHFLFFIQTEPDKSTLEEFIRTHYLVYASEGSNRSRDVLFTGYYEPSVKGSFQKSDEYPYPVYSRPDDLISVDISLFSPRFKNEKLLIGRLTEKNSVVPYYDRKEINQENALEKTVSPIAWVNNRIDLFFLEIQGSGKLFLDSGQVRNLSYHGKNGRPYRSIGKLLIDQEKIPRSEMSMQRIKQYLDDHPEEVDDILNHNTSYVFFKITEGGPYGCYGVQITPRRTVALQKKIFPPCALAFVKTQQPLINNAGVISRWVDFSNFVLNQDTGGAIRGPGRGDLFWGNGTYAEIAAGHMQHPGKLYFLVLKP